MKKIRRRFAALLAVFTVLFCVAWGGLSALATTLTITDNSIANKLVMVGSTRGHNDSVWYYFKPTQSGTYTLYGMAENTKNTEAYLFLKDGKTYTQLAYAGKDTYSRYTAYDGCANNQFSLTYHLDAGNEYYYTAGWLSETLEETRTLETRMVCDSYDKDVLDHITVDCDAALTWYTDGQWQQDSDGDTYFYYNISKIIRNLQVTLVYKDGSTLTSDIGATEVDGYTISYSHNQSEEHWYTADNALYNGNVLTVTVLNMSVDYNVVIEPGAMYTYRGAVCDAYSGEAIAGAAIKIGGATAATTKSDGTFSVAYAPGTYTATVESKFAVPRTFTVTVDPMNTDNNDHTSTPVPLVTADYTQDGTVNGRDYVYIRSTLTGTAQTQAKAAFDKYAGFTAEQYASLIL